MNINLPVGKETKILSIDDNIDYEVLMPQFGGQNLEKESAIREAILNPISSERICNLVGKDDKIAIVMTDITRKLPEDIILKVIHEELKTAGVKDENVTIVIANGTHRPDTEDEIIEMYGGEALCFNIVNHNAYDKNDLSYLGNTRSGIPVWINKYVSGADFTITTGVIEPHLFAGYSGGVKTVAVGTAGIDTIGSTHNYQTLSDSRCRLGQIIGNIFREYLNEINECIGVNFIVNVIQDGEKNLKAVVAGDPYMAFEKGVELARPLYECYVDGPADIVISCPGYPKSRDLYQATRSWNTIMFGPQPIVKEGGTIIIPCPCEDGVGHMDFEEQLSNAKDVTSLLNDIRNNGFKAGEHKPFIAARVLNHANVAITDCLIDKHVINNMQMKWYDNLQTAFSEIINNYRNPKVYVMPYGIITLPIIRHQGEGKNGLF